MQIAMPHFPCSFEIPDEWILEAGFTNFRATADSFNCAEGVPRPLAEIEPSVGFLPCPKDRLGFDKERFVQILRGFVAGDVIPAVPVATIPPSDFPRSVFKFRVQNGFHRFYASLAAGFTALPVEVLDA